MRGNHQRHQDSPPALDEGYWASLLNDVEALVDGPPGHHESDEPHSNPREGGSGSEPPAGHASDWELIQQIKDADEALDLPVTGHNRGGLLVEWRTLRGFIPASQLLDFPPVTNEAIRKRVLANAIGKVLHLRVIELNPAQNRLILSERAASTEPGERAHVLSRLTAGEHVHGTVTNLCDFGAFIDLGGIEGLIHISELSWGRVGHPTEVLARGQQLEARVLEVHPETGRVALSYKRLHPDPWITAAERYQVGAMIEGSITTVVDFGAFVRIEEGLEGLIHVSELADGYFMHPRSVVNEGQRIRARILSIDGRARRLGLSLRSGTNRLGDNV